MSINTFLNKVTTIEKEAATLQKRLADEERHIAEYERKTAEEQRKASNTKSSSMLNMYMRNCKNYIDKKNQALKKKSDIAKKISDNAKKLADARLALTKSQTEESKKLTQVSTAMQTVINTQEDKLTLLMSQFYPTVIINKDEYPVEKKYDFFISHASEDKEDLVRDLAEALSQKGFKVWYDETELLVGDSLRKKIDEGLACSRFGIVVVSPNFVRKRWTEYELNGMVAREMNGIPLILPIWHNISMDEVLKFSPSLADKKALKTSDYTIDEIVSSLAARLIRDTNTI